MLLSLLACHDINLSYPCISTGYVAVSGLFRLTDGIACNSTKQLNGFQALASGMCSIKIRQLNLHGCFRVRDLALKALSSMTNIESLVLSGCKSLCFQAVATMAKECRVINHLSLAGCGACVTDEMIDSITFSLHKLKILDLSDCVNLSERIIKFLPRCPELSYLNLSGCKKISNQGILSFGEGNFIPGLQELHLNSCPKIDDNALTWILHCFRDGCGPSNNKEKLTLTTLAVKGTK